jgi:hypothetical protein
MFIAFPSVLLRVGHRVGEDGEHRLGLRVDAGARRHVSDVMS